MGRRGEWVCGWVMSWKDKASMVVESRLRQPEGHLPYKWCGCIMDLRLVAQGPLGLRLHEPRGIHTHIPPPPPAVTSPGMLLVSLVNKPPIQEYGSMALMFLLNPQNSKE